VIDWRYWLGKPSQHIGVVYDCRSRKVLTMINPDWDGQLDDPCWLNGNPDLRMMKIERGSMPSSFTFATFADVQQFAESALSWRK
jgi:hypothetical protein